MNVTVIGAGFVGVVSAAVFAKLKNQVWCLDRTPSKVKSLNQAIIPFHEPQLQPLVAACLKAGTLKFTTSYKKAISKADVIVIAVGTPSAPDGQADLTAVLSAAKSMAPHLKPGAIIIVKSTVPPGTNSRIVQEINSHTQVKFYTASVPEFLREGTAVADTLHPDRIVVGATESKVIQTLKILHRPLGGHIIAIKPESAQMAKYTANAYLAQRITFINQIANLCEKNGADVQEVINAIGPDRRIGTHYWYPGLGYGGSCFPKDVRELAAYSKSVGEGTGLFVKIDQLNEKRLPKLITKFGHQVGGWKNKRVALLGLSFKPETDDLREAPSLKIIPLLQAAGATVTGYDPVVTQIPGPTGKHLTLAPDPYAAAHQADVAILLIEWPQLLSLNLKLLKRVMRGSTFIDTRNQYSPQQVTQSGLEYIGIGR